MVNVNPWDVIKTKKQLSGEPHPGQKKILTSPARFKVIVCGRRWGKTVYAVIKLVLSALSTPNGVFWYIAPTYRQARTIAWRMLMNIIRLFPQFFQDKCRIEKNNLIIELPNHAIIELKGAQDPDALVGSGLDGVVFDEYAMEIFGVSPVWKESIRPALSDKLGWAVFISTPRGYNHFYDLYEFASSGQDSDWAAWKMPTSTNPYITKKELEAARREVGEDLYQQEYMAEFKKRSGLVYKEFQRDIHVIPPMDPAAVPHKWGLEVGVDFGSSHPTAGVFVLFSDLDDTAYIVDEYYQSEQQTTKNASAMKSIEDKWLAGMKQRAPRVRWGDSQAAQTILDFHYAGYTITPTLKGAGSVDSGISEVRKRLQEDVITGKPKLFITSNCVNTIREFENYVWAGTQDAAIEIDDVMRLANKKKDAPRKVFDDAMDALRYVLQYHVPGNTQFMVRRRKKVRNPLVGI